MKEITVNQHGFKHCAGLLCGSCAGIGKVEPIIERMHNRLPYAGIRSRL